MVVLKAIKPIFKEIKVMIKVKTEAQERKESFIQMVFWAAIWLTLLSYLTGCSNWQGMEFKIGVGQYNGANETKTFTRDTKAPGRAQE